MNLRSLQPHSTSIRHCRTIAMQRLIRAKSPRAGWGPPEVCLHPLHLPAPDIMLAEVQTVEVACIPPAGGALPAPSLHPLHRLFTSCTTPAPQQASCPALSAPHTSGDRIAQETNGKREGSRSKGCNQRTPESRQDEGAD